MQGNSSGNSVVDPEVVGSAVVDLEVFLLFLVVVGVVVFLVVLFLVVVGVVVFLVVLFLVVVGVVVFLVVFIYSVVVFLRRFTNSVVDDVDVGFLVVVFSFFFFFFCLRLVVATCSRDRSGWCWNVW